MVVWVQSVVPFVVPPASNVVTDNFDRADGGLGSNWSSISVGGSLQISSSTCVDVTASQHGVSVWTANNFANDQFVEANIAVAGSFTGLVLRGDAVARNFYVCYFAPGNATTFYRWDAGSANLIGNISGSISPTPSDVVRLEVSGTTFSFKVNGVLQGTQTDATYASGKPGFDIFSTGQAMDNFRAGPTV